MGLLDRFVVRDQRTGDDPRVQRRLEMVPSADLPMWVDNTLSNAGRYIQQYLRDGDLANLKEARTSCETLLTLVEELERRVA